MESLPTNQPTPTPVLGFVLQTILHKSYEQIKAFGEWLKENTQQYLIGEHEADDKIKTTHCHILIEGLKVSREALRKQIIKVAPGRGQNCTMMRSQRLKLIYERDPLARYIIKGRVIHIKESSFEEIQHAIWASGWSATKVASDKPAVDSAVAAKERNVTIYDVCLKVFENGQKEVKLDRNNALMPHFLPNMDNWHLMCQELNKAKIRTSRNELERVWVTILRQDSENQNDLFYSIQSSVFRHRV